MVYPCISFFLCKVPSKYSHILEDSFLRFPVCLGICDLICDSGFYHTPACNYPLSLVLLQILAILRLSHPVFSPFSARTERSMRLPAALIPFRMSLQDCCSFIVRVIPTIISGALRPILRPLAAEASRLTASNCLKITRKLSLAMRTNHILSANN